MKHIIHVETIDQISASRIDGDKVKFESFAGGGALSINSTINNLQKH